MMSNRNRRSVITAVGAAGTVGLAGCLSSIDGRRGVAGESAHDGEPPAESPSSDSDADTDGDLADLPGDPIRGVDPLEEWVTMIDRGNLAVDEADPYAGARSVRLSADEEIDYAGIYTTVPQGVDLSGKTLSLAVRFTGRDQLQLVLELLAPNSRNVLSLRRTLTGPTDRWVRVDFGATRVDTMPDLSDVREIRLTARRRGTVEGPIECWLDDLRTVDRPEMGRVMLLFDSTLESHHSTAFEPMEAYGFAGVEAVIPEAVGRDGRLTLDALYELSDAGWDVAARPRTGARYLHEFSPEEQAGMVRRTKTYLQNRGFEAGAKHFVTPRDVVSPASMDAVREHHEQAFRFGGGPNGLPLTDPHNVGVFSGHDGDETKRYVDLAAQYGQLAVLRFEHVGNEGISAAEFEELLAHVDGQDVRVVTATELLEST